jgi:hypothetical protein
MLIKNDREREAFGLPTLSQLCEYCDRSLAMQYPVVFAGERKRVGYHLACASHLASEITEAVSVYLSEISEQQKHSTMAEAFRRARES